MNRYVYTVTRITISDGSRRVVATETNKRRAIQSARDRKSPVYVFEVTQACRPGTRCGVVPHVIFRS